MTTSRRWCLLLLPPVAAMLFAPSSGAQSEPVLEAAPMAVLTTPVATEAVNAYGGVVTHIDRRQIELLGAKDFQTALRRATGVGISRFNAVGSFGGAEGGSVYIRGRGTGRPGGEIRLYSDGVPREVGVWGHPLLDTMPLRHIDRVVIAKGPQPVLYGGTFGAIDTASPQRYDEGVETIIDAGAGEFATWNAGVRHGVRQGPVDVYGGVSILESDGHRDHSGAVLRAQYARLGVALTESLQAAYLLHRTDNWSDDPGPVGSPTPQRDRFGSETLTQSLQLRNRGDRLSGHLILYHEDGRIRWAKDVLGGPGTPPGDSNTDWENLGLRMLQDLQVGVVTLTGGLDLSREGGSTENRTLGGMVPFAFRDHYRTVSPAAAVRADLEWGATTVTPSAGARYYRHSRFDSETAPQAGIVVRRDAWRVFANASRGVHYPGVYAAGVSAGTEDALEAEILKHLEVGLGGRCPWTGTDVQLSLFRDETDNQLQRTPAGLVNRKRADIDGLELTLRYARAGGFSLFSGLTLLDAADAKTPRAPGVTAAAGVHVPLPLGLSLQLDAEYVDSQYAFNGRDTDLQLAAVEKLDRYLTANARLACALRGGDAFSGEVYLAVENLTNEDYAYWPGYPMARRHVSAGLQVAF